MDPRENVIGPLVAERNTLGVPVNVVAPVTVSEGPNELSSQSPMVRFEIVTSPLSRKNRGIAVTLYFLVAVLLGTSAGDQFAGLLYRALPPRNVEFTTVCAVTLETRANVAKVEKAREPGSFISMADIMEQS